MWLSGGGCGWNLLVWLVGVFLIYITYIYIPTALVSALFCSNIPTSFFILLIIIYFRPYVVP